MTQETGQHLLPISILIVGPPKCGKSTLIQAMRSPGFFHKDYFPTIGHSRATVEVQLSPTQLRGIVSKYAPTTGNPDNTDDTIMATGTTEPTRSTSKPSHAAAVVQAMRRLTGPSTAQTSQLAFIHEFPSWALGSKPEKVFAKRDVVVLCVDAVEFAKALAAGGNPGSSCLPQLQFHLAQLRYFCDRPGRMSIILAVTKAHQAALVHAGALDALREVLGQFVGATVFDADVAQTGSAGEDLLLLCASSRLVRCEETQLLQQAVAGRARRMRQVMSRAEVDAALELEMPLGFPMDGLPEIYRTLRCGRDLDDSTASTSSNSPSAVASRAASDSRGSSGSSSGAASGPFAERETSERKKAESSDSADGFIVSSAGGETALCWRVGVFRSNRLRRFCLEVVRGRYSRCFDRFVLVCVVLSCAFVLMDDPSLGGSSSSYRYVSAYFNFIVTYFVFIPEMLLRILALGFLCHADAYLRDGWSYLDIICVAGGVVDSVALFQSWGPGAGGVLAAFSPTGASVARAVRLLRPLRSIRHFPSVRENVRTMGDAGSSLLSVLVPVVGFVFFAALIGLTVLQGTGRNVCALQTQNTLQASLLRDLSASGLTLHRFDVDALLAALANARQLESAAEWTAQWTDQDGLPFQDGQRGLQTAPTLQAARYEVDLADGRKVALQQSFKTAASLSADVETLLKDLLSNPAAAASRPPLKGVEGEPGSLWVVDHHFGGCSRWHNGRTVEGSGAADLLSWNGRPPLTQLNLDSAVCRAPFQCHSMAPELETVNFESLPSAMLSVFLLMTVEGWGDAMAQASSVAGEVVAIFFIALVYVGALMLLQMIVVAILIAFANGRDALEDDLDNDDVGVSSVALAVARQQQRWRLWQAVCDNRRAIEARRWRCGMGGCVAGCGRFFARVLCSCKRQRMPAVQAAPILPYKQSREEGQAELANLVLQQLNARLGEDYGDLRDLLERPSAPEPPRGGAMSPVRPPPDQSAGELSLPLAVEDDAEAPLGIKPTLAASEAEAREVAQWERRRAVMRRFDRAREMLADMSHVADLAKVTVVTEVGGERGAARNAAGWRGRLSVFVGSPLYVNTMLVITLANVCVLAADSHSQSESKRKGLESANLVCVIIFALDMVLKLIGLGVRGYLRVVSNILDGIIVAASLLEWSLGSIGSSSGLRLYRALRILQLVRLFPQARNFLWRVVRASKKVLSIAFLLALSLFIFATAGRLVVGGSGLSDASRFHWDTIWDGLWSSFVLLTGDDWTNIFEAARESSGVAGALLVVACLVANAYILMSLLVATIVDAFVAVPPGTDDDRQLRLPRFGRARQRASLTLQQAKAALRRMLTEETRCFERLRRRVYRFVTWWVLDVFVMVAIVVSTGLLILDSPYSDEYSPLYNFSARCAQDAVSIIFVVEMLLKWIALGIFCPYEDTAVHVSRFVSKAELRDAHRAARVAPLNGDATADDSLDDEARQRAEDAENAIGERLVNATGGPLSARQAASLSVVGGIPRSKFDCTQLRSYTVAYFRDGWNYLDFVAVVAAVVDVVLRGLGGYGWMFEIKLTPGVTPVDLAMPSTGGLAFALRALRALRTLRPLRLLPRVPSLRLTINCMLRVGPRSAQVVLVAALILAAFAVVGIGAFKGRFGECSNPCLLLRADCEGAGAYVQGFADYWARVAGEGRLAGLDLRPGQLGSTADEVAAQRYVPLGSRPASLQHQPRAPVFNTDGAYSAMPALTLAEDEVFVEYLRAGHARSVELCPELKDRCGPQQVDGWLASGRAGGLNMSLSTLLETRGSVSDGSVMPTWLSPYLNFDSFGNSFVSLTVVASLEGWTGVASRAMDIVGLDIGPCRDANFLPAAIFFIVFVFCGAFFAVNLFGSVVIERFSEEVARVGLTPMQQVVHQHIRDRLRPSVCRPRLRPRHPLSVLVRYRVVETRLFKIVIFVFLLFLVGVAVEDGVRGTDGMLGSSGVVGNASGLVERVRAYPWSSYRVVVDLIVIGVFFAEMVLKLVAYGARYFASGWNCFDCVIVVASIAALVASVLVGADHWTRRAGAAVRLLRIFRLVRYVHYLKGVHTVLRTVVASLTAVVNVAVVMVVSFVVFALVAMTLFAQVPDGTVVGRDFGARTFGQALLTLIYVATGEAWTALWLDLVQPPACQAGAPAGDEVCAFLPASLRSEFVVAEVNDWFASFVADLDAALPGSPLPQELERLSPALVAQLFPDGLLSLGSVSVEATADLAAQSSLSDAGLQDVVALVTSALGAQQAEEERLRAVASAAGKPVDAALLTPVGQPLSLADRVALEQALARALDASKLLATSARAPAAFGSVRRAPWCCALHSESLMRVLVPLYVVLFFILHTHLMLNIIVAVALDNHSSIVQSSLGWREVDPARTAVRANALLRVRQTGRGPWLVLRAQAEDVGFLRRCVYVESRTAVVMDHTNYADFVKHWEKFDLLGHNFVHVSLLYPLLLSLPVEPFRRTRAGRMLSPLDVMLAGRFVAVLPGQIVAKNSVWCLLLALHMCDRPGSLPVSFLNHLMRTANRDLAAEIGVRLMETSERGGIFGGGTGQGRLAGDAGRGTATARTARGPSRAPPVKLPSLGKVARSRLFGATQSAIGLISLDVFAATTLTQCIFLHNRRTAADEVRRAAARRVKSWRVGQRSSDDSSNESGNSDEDLIDASRECVRPAPTFSQYFLFGELSHRFLYEWDASEDNNPQGCDPNRLLAIEERLKPAGSHSFRAVQSLARRLCKANLDRALSLDPARANALREARRGRLSHNKAQGEGGRARDEKTKNDDEKPEKPKAKAFSPAGRSSLHRLWLYCSKETRVLDGGGLYSESEILLLCGGVDSAAAIVAMECAATAMFLDALPKGQ